MTFATAAELYRIRIVPDTVRTGDLELVDHVGHRRRGIPDEFDAAFLVAELDTVGIVEEEPHLVTFGLSDLYRGPDTTTSVLP